MNDLEAIRRQRLLDSPTVLRGAFRLLFLGGTLWALVVIVLWVLAFTGAMALPTAMAPLAWHQHEMLFGYLGAVIAGFLSAAVPNWTGRPPFAGWPVAAFVGLWLAARLGLLFSAVVPLSLAAALDVGFLVLLALAAAREIVAARNRNLPIVLALSLLALASALDYAETLGWHGAPGLGMRSGLALVLVLIAIVGGRIVPAFTRNWLTSHGHAAQAPGQAGRFDQIALAALPLALAAWIGWPGTDAAAVLLLCAGAVHLVRLARWSGFAAVRDPLVFVLHVGYLWLPLGLLLLGASTFVPAIERSSALHALTAGCMATMTLAVMSRATLGHTGRPLRADGATVGVYVLVTLGAALRVAAPYLPVDYAGTIGLAGLLWGASFLLFAVAYAPRLLGPRADGKPW
jgi:uncharacterized protein involved in response to NO